MSKNPWAKLKYDAITAPLYPEYVPRQEDGTIVLPDPETQPHPVHRDNEYSLLLARVQRTELQDAPEGIVLFELREVKTTGYQYVIGINKFSRPVPTPQHVIESIQVASSSEAKHRAKQQLTFLLSQPTNVLTAYNAYMEAVRSGEVPILKDYIERILGKADSVDDNDAAGDLLQGLSNEDIAKLAK